MLNENFNNRFCLEKDHNPFMFFSVFDRESKKECKNYSLSTEFFENYSHIMAGVSSVWLSAKRMYFSNRRHSFWLTLVFELCDLKLIELISYLFKIDIIFHTQEPQPHHQGQSKSTWRETGLGPWGVTAPGSVGVEPTTQLVP